MTPQPHLELDAVGKTYGDVTVLDGVSVAVRPGEFHCLSGPNGAGKSTLFRLAAGLTRPSSGRVVRHADRVGCGFQTPNFYPDLTVAENLDVFGRLAGGPGADDAWVETLTSALRLDRTLHQRGDELSGGFQTALDLALALLARPQVVLLDEPLAELDGASKDRVVDVLDAYRTGDLDPDEGTGAAGASRDSGGTGDAPERSVVVATHNVDQFEDAATWLTLLADGEVVLDARVEDARAELPASADGEPGALQSQYEDLVRDHWGYRSDD